MSEVFRHKIAKGHSLLVKGAAAVTLISGRVHVFLSEINPKERFVIPKGRRIPLEARQDSVIEITLSSSYTLEEIPTTAIPKEWSTILSTIKSIIRSRGRIVIVGGVDSGKSSLATLIVNYFTLRNVPTSILDVDVGQTEVGLPAALGFGGTCHPVKGLFEVTPKALFFIGSITPAPVIEKILTGVHKLIPIAEKQEGILVVNTDGWIEGDEALNYKIKLIKTVDPDLIIVIGEKDQIYESLKNYPRNEIIHVTKSPFVYKRDREERKSLREQTYYKYLKNGTVREFSLSQVKGDYCTVKEEDQKNMNILVGLIGKEGLMQGPGILKRVNIPTDKAFIYSEVSSQIEIIEVGMIQIREDGHELGFITR